MHDVFPKAKFRDCIQLTVAASKNPRVQAQRRGWIGMTKEKPLDEENMDEEGLDALRNVEREATGLNV
jgi:Replication Fork Protection Component Swi3